TLNYMLHNTNQHGKVNKDKARKYLSVQINDVELEEELLKATSKLVEEKTTKKVSDTSESIVSGVSSTIGSTIGGISTLGSIIGRYDIKKVETTQTVISKQNQEGSFHLSDTLSEIL